MADAQCAMKHKESVRWLRDGEFEILVEMDSAIFSRPWLRSTMDEIVNKRNNLCAIVEDIQGDPAGFIIFEVQGDRFYVLKMGVLDGQRRSGLGRELLQFLTDRMTINRNKIEIDVREELALDAHKFYTGFGFKATGVRSDFFKVYDRDPEEPSHVEDSYNFVLDVVLEMPTVPMITEKREVVDNAGLESVNNVDGFVRKFL